MSSSKKWVGATPASNPPSKKAASAYTAMVPHKAPKEASHVFSHSVSRGDVGHGDHLRVSRWGSFYYHHGIACRYGVLKKYEEEIDINQLRLRKGKEPFTGLNDDSIVMIEHNLDGLGVVSLKEFREWGFTATKKSFSSTLRLVKYGMGAGEMTLKESGCGFTQQSLPVDIIVERAIQELINEERERRWEYNLIARNCENFALYCTGIVATWEGGWVEQLQVTQLLLSGTQALNKTLIFSLGPTIRRAVMKMHHFIGQIADPLMDVALLTGRVTSILRSVFVSGVASAIEFGFELIVATVRFLLPKKFVTLSITFKEWAKCVLSAFVANTGAFAGSLIGLLVGVPGGPLSILTAIIGGIVGGVVCRFSVRYVMNCLDIRKFKLESQRAIEMPTIKGSSIIIEEYNETELDGTTEKDVLVSKDKGNDRLELLPEMAFQNSSQCSLCERRVFRGITQHHCRHCFKTACGECSMFRVPLCSTSAPDITCKNCFEEHNQNGVFSVTNLTSDTLSNLASCVDASRVVSIGMKNFTPHSFQKGNVWFYSGISDLTLPETVNPDHALSWQARKIPHTPSGSVGVFVYFVPSLHQSLVVWWSVPFDYNLYDNEWACAALEGPVSASKKLWDDQPTMFKASHSYVAMETGPFSVRGGIEAGGKAVLSIDVR